MRLYIPDMDDMFAYLDYNEFSYVVLRGFNSFYNSYPQYGSKEDVDLLVNDNVVDYLLQRYSHVSRRGGVKCDFYAPSPRAETDFSGYPYYPHNLAQQLLNRRIKWRERFFVPAPEYHFYSLLFHVAYHKAETSGFDFSNPERGMSTKYYSELKETGKQAGLETDYTLKGAHYLLAGKNYDIENKTLISYVRREFNRGRKSYFFGWLCNQQPGEMNLFVIRRTAVVHNRHIDILRVLQKRYKILALKRVSWITRLGKVNHMRGGKWRRGGKPYIAVVVFDPCPVETSPEERMVHPHVFNRNQFFKPELREWFLNSTNARKKDNPLHSTDNEAEAIGHLPLFFDEDEQNDIFVKLARERSKIKGAGQQN